MRSGFTDAPVSAAVIDEIVEGGLIAPSSKDAQPWRLHVVCDRETIAAIAADVAAARNAKGYVPIDPATGAPRPRMVSTVPESASALRTAPLAIFVENRGDFSGGRDTVAEARRAVLPGALVGYGLEHAGLGACLMCMWVVALSHDLGGAFMGDVAIVEDQIGARLGFTGDLLGVLALGYPRAPAPYPRKLRDDRVVRHDLTPAKSSHVRG